MKLRRLTGFASGNDERHQANVCFRPISDLTDKLVRVLLDSRSLRLRLQAYQSRVLDG